MFDAFLRERGERRRSAGARLRRVRRRQAAAGRRALVPRVARDRAPEPALVGRELGTRKNDLVLELIDERGVEGYDGSVRVRRGGARRPGMRLRRRVLEQQLPSRCSGGRHRGPLRGARRRRRRRARGAPREARAGHVPGRRAPARRRAGPRPPSSRTRSPACRPAAPARSAGSSASTASDHADALREHGADIVVQRPGRAAGGAVIESGRLLGRAVGGPRARAASRSAGPDRVGLRALERPHRPARQPRRGRAARRARHVPERRSSRSARCRTPSAATAIPRRARR